MSTRILIQNGLIVTMNPQRDIFKGDILIENHQLKLIEEKINTSADEIFDAEGYIITPGLIQTHVHLCQTLFRNLADDLDLLDWLGNKIWPFEAKHTPDTLRVSASLGIAELIKSGTTTILDMGTVHHQDVVFEELKTSGLRAYSGKAMMDFGDMPAGLLESTESSIDESMRLYKTWHNFDNGRLKYAFAPRFVLSCSDELLKEVGSLAKEYQTLYHTHASENKSEIALVEQRFGMRNIEVFEKFGLADNNLCLAHCIWIDENEKNIIQSENINVMHCPSANLKLGSGIAPVPDYLNHNVNVSIGCDGAPCNNNLDIITEMRHAALIQKPLHGSSVMTAEDVFTMATVNGARTLGQENEIGSIEANKLADLTFIKTDQVHSIPYENVYSKIVYSCKSTDVKHVMVNGKWLLKDGQLKTIDESGIIQQANKTIPHFWNN